MTTPTGIGKHRGEDPPAPKHWMPFGEHTGWIFQLIFWVSMFLLVGMTRGFPWEGP